MARPRHLGMIEHAKPRAHLVMDDFFGPPALEAIFEELRSLERRMKPGLVRDLGHDGQSVFFAHERRRNRALWIHEPSKTLRLFREQLWSDAMSEAFENAREPLFQIIPRCWAPHLQVSSYMTGDHYAFHEDEGAGVNLTVIVFLAADPKKVRGGDLVLAYRGEETKVRFRHNRLVVFPSKTPHRVTRVRVDSTDTKHARISLQSWLTYGRPEAKAKPERRAAEADHPTFLLAEESIVSAAQAFCAPAGTDQSPEDVYWGAFYLSRIMSSNLRCLVAEEGSLQLGRIQIRRGEAVEVYGRGRLGGEGVRVGILLRGPPTPPAEALRVFVEMGRGKAKTMLERALPPGAREQDAAAALRSLLAKRGA
jgi:hypothetical protein